MTEGIDDRRTRTAARAARLVRVAPFAAGALVAFGAVILFNLLVPGPPRLTKDDVDARIGEALASMTPAPAFSEVVYQAVRPSLVLIETERPEAAGSRSPDAGIGSGVVVNLAGDILTSLHVVDDATASR